MSWIKHNSHLLGCAFIFFSSQWLQVNTPALLCRYSRCIQEAALNTANSTGAGGGGGMGQGPPVRPTKLVLTRQSAFGGSKTSMGGPHSRAAGECRLGEGQLFPALSDPGGGSSFFYFIPLPPPPLRPSPPPLPVFSFISPFFYLKNIHTSAPGTMISPNSSPSALCF